MSLIGFRREGGDIEYLEEAEYSEEHLEEDLHGVIIRSSLTAEGHRQTVV